MKDNDPNCPACKGAGGEEVVETIGIMPTGRLIWVNCQVCGGNGVNPNYKPDQSDPEPPKKSGSWFKFPSL